MKFSVALCTYNGERFIEEQINSILQQTVAVSEIVICDDNSKDNTIAIAEQILKDSGVSYQIFVNNPPLGVADNFLKALKLTSGDYVFTCDQDDVWHKDKVEIFASAIAQSRKLLYFSDGILVDGAKNPLGSNLWTAFGIDRELSCGDAMLHILIRHSAVTGAAMVVSRELIDQISDIPKDWIHDEWLAMVAAAQDSIEPVFKATFDYRQHGANVMGAKRLNVFEKVKFWFHRIGKMQPLRIKQLARIKNVLPLVESTSYEGFVRDAVAFWETVVKLPELGFFKGVLCIGRLYKSGAYTHFYTGIRGAVRDVLSCVIDNAK